MVGVRIGMRIRVRVGARVRVRIRVRAMRNLPSYGYCTDIFFRTSRACKNLELG